MSMINTATAGAALRAKLNAAKGADRADMYLADVTPVSASEAKLLIGYNPTFGVPAHAQVSNFVAASTTHLSKTGPVSVQLETLANHPVNRAQAAVSVVVSSPRRTMSMPASGTPANMVALSSTMFYDNALQANWAIQTRPDGVKFLECTSKENVPELLNTAIASQGVISRGVSFAMPEIQATASLQVSVGDFVEFWADGGLHRGDVTKVTESEVVIHGDDRPWTVSCSAVTKILRLNPKAQSEEEKRQIAFFSGIWGKEFATEFVKGQQATKAVKK